MQFAAEATRLCMIVVEQNARARCRHDARVLLAPPRDAAAKDGGRWVPAAPPARGRGRLRGLRANKEDASDNLT